MQKPIVISLVVLVILLATLGVFTKDAAVLTMAASALTGLFAWLQVQPK